MQLVLLATLMALSDFVAPLPGGGFSTGRSFVFPTPGGGWAWDGGIASPTPGGGWIGEGFDTIPGWSASNPWGLERRPIYPGCDGQPGRRWLDPWAWDDGAPPVTPYPYGRRR